VNSDTLRTTFSALAHPARRAILGRLARGEASVGELARPFRMTQPAVSKHLAVLERAGLISRGRNKQWRPCRLHARPLKDAAAWMDHYRRFWEGTLDRLEEFLADVAPVEGEGRERTAPAQAPEPTASRPARRGANGTRRRHS